MELRLLGGEIRSMFKCWSLETKYRHLKVYMVQTYCIECNAWEAGTVGTKIWPWKNPVHSAHTIPCEHSEGLIKAFKLNEWRREFNSKKYYCLIINAYSQKICTVESKTLVLSCGKVNKTCKVNNEFTIFNSVRLDNFLIIEIIFSLLELNIVINKLSLWALEVCIFQRLINNTSSFNQTTVIIRKSMNHLTGSLKTLILSGTKRYCHELLWNTCHLIVLELLFLV